MLCRAGLFEEREARLRDERNVARQQAKEAGLEREAADGRARDLAQKVESLSKDYENAQAQTLAAQAMERRAQAEASALAARLAELEDEMRQLMAVVEQQKQHSASKMKQLATLLQDL